MSESERDRILELVSARLDGELTAEEAAELERALAESPELVREAESLESTVAWLTEEGGRRVPGDRAEPDFATSVMDRIGADESGASSSSAPSERPRFRFSRWLPMVSLAASILLAAVFIFDATRPPTGHFEADSMAKDDGLAQSEKSSGDDGLAESELPDEADFQRKQAQEDGWAASSEAKFVNAKKGDLADSAPERDGLVERSLAKNARSKGGLSSESGDRQIRALGYASDAAETDGADAAGRAATRGRRAAYDSEDTDVETPSESTNEDFEQRLRGEPVVLEIRLPSVEAAENLAWLDSWEPAPEPSGKRERSETRNDDRRAPSDAERVTEGAAKPPAPESSEPASSPRFGAREASRGRQDLGKSSPSARSKPGAATSKPKEASDAVDPSKSHATPAIWQRDLTPRELAQLEKAFEARGVRFRRVVDEPGKKEAAAAAGGGLAIPTDEGALPGAQSDAGAPTGSGADPLRGVAPRPARPTEEPTERIRVTIRLTFEPIEGRKQ